MLATEPKDDVPFVARSRSALADEYRRSLFPSGGSADDLKLVTVRRDPAGQLFLYRPCGLGHRREIISNKVLVLDGHETWQVPIRTTKQDADGFTLDLDTSDLPPFIPHRVRYRATPTHGLYQVQADDGSGTDLMMTVEEAAKLDIVVRPCRVEKRFEIECRSQR